MRVVMFALGAFLVTCAAIGWCCVYVGGTWDDDELDYD